MGDPSDRRRIRLRDSAGCSDARDRPDTPPERADRRREHVALPVAHLHVRRGVESLPHRGVAGDAAAPRCPRWRADVARHQRELVRRQQEHPVQQAGGRGGPSSARRRDTVQHLCDTRPAGSILGRGAADVKHGGDVGHRRAGVRNDQLEDGSLHGAGKGASRGGDRHDPGAERRESARCGLGDREDRAG